MEASFTEFLRDKNMLLTGLTGFLGKILIEKILRIQPGISCIYVLMRSPDIQSANLRLRNEVVNMELFRCLRERHGNEDFEKFFFSKVVPVLGDIAVDNLGIDSNTSEELLGKLDVIVNSAATTVFDERYDVALNTNVKGAKNIVEFGRRCGKLQILIHVSTAYVCGRRSGIIMEKPKNMGETERKSAETLDIAGEFDILEKFLAHMQADTSTKSPENTESRRLKALGLERSKKFGWPNTYTFTKAMGEMLIGSSSGDLPVVIIRPSIIESTMDEPFPGWIEGTRTIDTLILRYGKGRIPIFLADPHLLVDLIPADMVVNVMMVAMAVHASQNGLSIYHVATSVGNPLQHSVGIDSAMKYFRAHPCVSKHGKAVRVKKPHLLESMKSFRKYMHLHYKAPLKVFGAVDKVFCNFFRKRYKFMLRKYDSVMYLAELYEPFVFFEGRFDITNTNGLLKRIESAEDQKNFNLDVRCIDWPRYFLEVHIPGLVKHVFR